MSLGGERANIPHNYKERPGFTLAYFWPTWRRESTPACKFAILSLRKYIKELKILSWTEVGSDFYKSRKTIRLSEILKMNPTLRYFFVPGSETGQQSAPHIQLQLMSREATARGRWQNSCWEKFWHVCQMAIKVFRSVFYKCSLQVHNYNSSRWLEFERFSNFLTKVEYPSFSRRSLKFQMIVILVQQWLPTCCCFCHMTLAQELPVVLQD